MQIGKKRDEDIRSTYEEMPEKDLFLLVRDDLLYSRTGISLDGQFTENGKKKFWEDINRYVLRVYRISTEKLQKVDAYMEDYIFRFHVLTPVMEAEGITDIKVLAWNNVRVKEGGKRREAKISFWSKEDFRGFVEMLAVRNGINLGNLNAIQTFTDKKSSDAFIYRFDISTGVINSSGEPYLHIRKIPKKKYTMEDLTALGMFGDKVCRYLQEQITAGYMVICGKNGSGKTYLLNALLEKVPHTESALVVQENEELFSGSHPDMMFQHIAVHKGERKVSYGLKELVINGLLTDIDHIVIGEIKGEEAVYFLSAALAGCSGMTTVHSMNAAGAIDKLADYCIWEGSYQREEVLKLLDCIQTIVYIEDFKVQEILERSGRKSGQKRKQLETVYSRVEGIDKI